MIPYVFPIGLFVAMAALRLMPGLAARFGLMDVARWSLAAMLVVTGSAHFVGLRQDMIAMVPPVFPRPDVIVTATGVLELLGAAALFWRGTRDLAGVALALLFVAMFPANIYAAQQGLSIGGKAAPSLATRLPEQLLFIALALAPVWRSRRGRRHASPPDHPALARTH
jgi:uncharacterized membrane protein